jgi:arsenate reductase
MHPIVYGIPNCDTVKKARTWLSQHGLNASFHDFKKQGVPAAELDTWLAAVGWGNLLNKKGSTWRQLDAEVQARVTDATTAKAVMQAFASTIKRPVIAWPSGQVTVGFTPDQWPL